jgi:hypothetical protein
MIGLKLSSRRPADFSTQLNLMWPAVLFARFPVLSDRLRQVCAINCGGSL